MFWPASSYRDVAVAGAAGAAVPAGAEAAAAGRTGIFKFEPAVIGLERAAAGADPAGPAGGLAPACL